MTTTLTKSTEGEQTTITMTDDKTGASVSAVVVGEGPINKADVAEAHRLSDKLTDKI